MRGHERDHETSGRDGGAERPGLPRACWGRGGIGAIHRAVATRAFSGVGPGGRPVQLVHDAISDRVYGLCAEAPRSSAREALRSRPPAAHHRARAVHHRARQRVLGVINGLIGDALEEEGSDLQEPMSVRMEGQVVPLEPAALAQAFPQATPRLAVFVHGLMETEFAWRLGQSRTGGTYASRLSRDLGCTPIERPIQHGAPHLGERPLAVRAARGARRGLARGARARSS